MKNVFRKNTVLFVAAIVHGSLLFWLFSNTELGRQPGVGAASQAYLDRKQQCHSLEMISEECKVDYFATRLPSGELISNEDEEEDPMLEKISKLTDVPTFLTCTKKLLVLVSRKSLTFQDWRGSLST
jgi:hypothetical protein